MIYNSKKDLYTIFSGIYIMAKRKVKKEVSQDNDDVKVDELNLFEKIFFVIGSIEMGILIFCSLLFNFDANNLAFTLGAFIGATIVVLLPVIIVYFIKKNKYPNFINPATKKTVCWIGVIYTTVIIIAIFYIILTPKQYFFENYDNYVYLEPEQKLDGAQLLSLKNTLQERLNVYGYPAIVSYYDKGLVVRVPDSVINQTENLSKLLTGATIFEAKLGNKTAFVGDKKDIISVCTNPDCAGIDPRRGCSSISNGYSCGFYFTITLSNESAARQAQLTKDLSIVTENGNEYLNQDLILYLNGVEVDRLKIGSELKGNNLTTIQISGSGFGATQVDAAKDSLRQMERLQYSMSLVSMPSNLKITRISKNSPITNK